MWLLIITDFALNFEEITGAVISNRNIANNFDILCEFQGFNKKNFTLARSKKTQITVLHKHYDERPPKSRLSLFLGKILIS